MLICTFLKAQVAVQINVGTPPMWGPIDHSNSRFYYLPDVESYYDIQSGMFIYYTGGVWVHKRHLPNAYRDYDLYNGYKVVLYDYHGNTPYMYFNNHRRQYARGYRGEEQHNRGEREFQNGNRKENSFDNNHDRDRHGSGNNRGNHESKEKQHR